jgi:excisionase family DNA binding protein
LRVATKGDRNLEGIASSKVGFNQLMIECKIRTHPPKVLNVSEASEYIGVSQRTLRSWIADRKIRVARLGGRVVLRLADVDCFIEKRLEGGA